MLVIPGQFVTDGTSYFCIAVLELSDSESEVGLMSFVYWGVFSEAESLNKNLKYIYNTIVWGEGTC